LVAPLALASDARKHFQIDGLVVTRFYALLACRGSLRFAGPHLNKLHDRRARFVEAGLAVCPSLSREDLLEGLRKVEVPNCVLRGGLRVEPHAQVDHFQTEHLQQREHLVFDRGCSLLGATARLVGVVTILSCS
jgi:hypothetical protein